MRKLLLTSFLLPVLGACVADSTFRSYPGEPRPLIQVATLTGASFERRDWINRYVDTVRFSRIDRTTVEASDIYDSVEVMPGYHDVTVYYSWDVGTDRGMIPALVNYFSTGDNFSRTLRFNARAGGSYVIHAEPVFHGESVNDITDLSHVDFWVEDEQGNIIVSRAEASFNYID